MDGVDPASVEQDSLREGGFAGVNMGAYTDIPQFGDVTLHEHVFNEEVASCLAEEANHTANNILSCLVEHIDIQSLFLY